MPSIKKSDGLLKALFNNKKGNITNEDEDDLYNDSPKNFKGQQIDMKSTFLINLGQQ